MLHDMAFSTIAMLAAANVSASDCPPASRYIYDQEGAANISDVFHTQDHIVSQQSKTGADTNPATEFAVGYKDCSQLTFYCLRFGLVDVLVPKTELPGTWRFGSLQCAVSRLAPGRLRGHCGEGNVTYVYEHGRGLTEYELALPNGTETYRLRGQCGLLSARI